MDPREIPLDLAGKIAQRKQQKEAEPNIAEPAELPQVRGWAVQFFQSLKEGVREAVERLNSSGSQQLSLQETNPYTIALANQSISVSIECSLLSVPTEHDVSTPAIQLRYKDGRREDGELLLCAPGKPGMGNSWLIGNTDTVFGDGSLQCIAEAILRYLLSGSFGIAGVRP